MNAASTVQPGSFLTLHYRLSGADGADIVNTFVGPPATLSLGNGELSPAIEQRLVGLAEGAEVRFELAPGEAFGQRSAELVQRVARSVLAEHGDPDEPYLPGEVVRFPTPDGSGEFAGIVREVGDEWIEFDFNHPLAGAPLVFEVRVIGVL